MLSKAAVIKKIGEDYVIENIEVAPPKANEILVKVAGCGLCHTDECCRDGTIPMDMPLVLGHEGSGVVLEIGPGVEKINVGDHVVLSTGWCGDCEMCLTGYPSLCVDNYKLNFCGVMADGTSRLSFNGVPLGNLFGQGTFSEYAVVHKNNAVVVDKDIDLTILGPLGCGIQTGAGTVLNGLKCEFGTSIVIFGTGAVGCSAIMAAKILNCQNIIAVDVVPEKLEFAKELGATHVINSKETIDIAKEVQDITKGGAHYSIDTTGNPTVINQAMYSLRINGQCAAIAVSGEVTMHLFNALTMQGKGIKGYVEGNSIAKLFIPKMIEYYKAGLFPFDKLMKVYEMDQINEAFDDVRKGKAIKAIIKM